ncbi:MAG: hypothetical protein FJZ78_10675 [Bacteroidetes bacterium]|nr:hypothetical protein [Bacteroidota bacterium]
MAKKSDSSAPDDDNFGLPDLDLTPLPEQPPVDSGSPMSSVPPMAEAPTSEEPVKPEDPPTPKVAVKPPVSPYRKQEEDTKTRTILLIVIPVVLVIGAFLGYHFLIEVPAEENKKKQQIEREQAEKRAKEEADRKAAEAAAAAAKAAPKEIIAGTTEILSGPTARYYVVVSSSLDIDLIMDYCKKLNAQGVTCKIIPPFGQWKLYRLTVENFDSFAKSQSRADQLKSVYGQGVWAMRY